MDYVATNKNAKMCLLKKKMFLLVAIVIAYHTFSTATGLISKLVKSTEKWTEQHRCMNRFMMSKWNRIT